MKKGYFILISCLIIGLLNGCSVRENFANRNLSAEQVVREHFKYRNEKNLAKLEETMTKDRKGITWQFENLDRIKIISIHEDKENKRKDGYMNNGRGETKKPAELRVYKVEYEVRFIDESKGPETSGNYEKVYYVIKELKDSPWLIDDWGYSY